MGVENSERANIGQVCRSLRRSKARKMLYYHLCDVSPSAENVKELAVFATLTLANAYGAMAGGSQNYRPEYSLAGMRLAERLQIIVDGKTVDMFRATEYGLSIRDRVEEYFSRVALDAGSSQTSGKVGAKA